LAVAEAVAVTVAVAVLAASSCWRPSVEALAEAFAETNCSVARMEELERPCLTLAQEHRKRRPHDLDRWARQIVEQLVEIVEEFVERLVS
jgi:hypothetical protein